MAASSKSRIAAKKTMNRAAKVEAVSVSRAVRAKDRLADFLSRRPHRSFKRSYRQDYVRSLELPSYMSLTVQAWGMLWGNRRLFASLILTYVVSAALLVGLASQDTFSILADTLKEVGGDVLSGGWGAVGQSGILLLTGVTGGFSGQLGEAQQIYSGFLMIMLWLASIWLLRTIMAGGSPRMRDGLYSAGSPLVAMTLVALLIAVQLIPGALGIIIYASALTTDLLSNGAIAMLVFFGAFLLAVLSVYLIISSFFATIIVTLPGMYPWRALRAAGDLVTGRRLRLLYRLTWLVGVVGIGWLVVMLPIVLLGIWLQGVTWLAWLPLVPVALLVLTASTLVYVSSYVYLLYRKVVEDDTSPA